MASMRASARLASERHDVAATARALDAIDATRAASRAPSR